MARGKSRTNKSRTLVEDLDADNSANKRSIFWDTEDEDSKSMGALDNEDSAGYQEDENISVKKQGSGTVYDRTPARRGRWEPQASAYNAKRKPRDIYTKKVDDSSEKEEQSKRKDAGNDAPDPNGSGEDEDDDSSKDEEEKVNNPEDAWTFFQSVC